MSDTFQSRWGFHPCDYQTFLKLKRLHRWYWQTLYDFHRWHRWQRKDATNRVGPEPKFCAIFVEDEPWFKPVTRHGERGFKVYPKTVVDRGVPDWYHAARRPQRQPPTPFDVHTLHRIDALYAEVRACFE